MCNLHYLRKRRHGSPSVRKRVANGGVLAWINDVALKHEVHGCLDWPFYRSARTGYAYMNFRGRPHHAARVICILAHGEPPFAGAEAAHSCGRGHEGCVSKGCLSWKTAKENSGDKFRHGTVKRGEQMPLARLTEDQVLSIFRDVRPQTEIASEYKCAQQTVGKIKTGHAWAWLTAGLSRPAPNRQPSGEKNGNAKFTADIVRQIFNSPLTPTESAREFGVSVKTVRDIRERRTWRIVTASL